MMRLNAGVAGLAEWKTPSGGTFLWLQLLGVKDSEAVVEKALTRGLVVDAGIHFTPANQNSPYIRVNFATVTEVECEEVRRSWLDNHYDIATISGNDEKLLPL